MSKPVIGVIFYSTYGHVSTLAEEIIKGVESTGAICKPYQIEETLSAEILGKMYGGASLTPKYPLATPEALKELDGFLLGAPTRYGRLPAQVSQFFDKTGGLWATGGLVGKFASTFTSTSSQHGGQETTHLTTIPFFAHHGIIYVPIGYTQPYLSDVQEAHGTSAYGVSTVAAPDGSRQPTEGELGVARYQGEYFAKVVAQSVRGRHLIAQDAAGTTMTASGADAKTAPVATQQLTADSITEKEKGYTVDEPAAAVAAAAAGGAAVAGGAVASGTAAAGAGAQTAKVAGTEPAVAAAPAAPATATTADATAKPAAAAAPKPAATARTEKKKGGLFSCCSGNNID